MFFPLHNNQSFCRVLWQLKNCLHPSSGLFGPTILIQKTWIWTKEECADIAHLVFIEQYAACRFSISTCSASFLVIPLDRLWESLVDHESDILFVDSWEIELTMWKCYELELVNSRLRNEKKLVPIPKAIVATITSTPPLVHLCCTRLRWDPFKPAW